MAYGESKGHVLADVTCPVFLFETDYILSHHFQQQS